MPTVATAICIVSFILTIGGIVGTFCWQLCRVAAHEVAQADRGDYLSSETRRKAAAVRVYRFAPFLTALFFFLWLATFFVPSQKTFYLIAASEAGEQAMQAPEFKKVRKVLNKWLDENSK